MLASFRPSSRANLLNRPSRLHTPVCRARVCWQEIENSWAAKFSKGNPYRKVSHRHFPTSTEMTTNEMRYRWHSATTTLITKTKTQASQILISGNRYWETSYLLFPLFTLLSCASSGVSQYQDSNQSFTSMDCIAGCEDNQALTHGSFSTRPRRPRSGRTTACNDHSKAKFQARTVSVFSC